MTPPSPFGNFPEIHRYLKRRASLTFNWQTIQLKILIGLHQGLASGLLKSVVFPHHLHPLLPSFFPSLFLATTSPSLIYCSSTSAVSIRGDIQNQKRDFLGIFPKCRPPPFWEPVFSKKQILFIFHFGPLGAFLVLTKMFIFWSILLLGIGDPPKNSLF